MQFKSRPLASRLENKLMTRQAITRRWRPAARSLTIIVLMMSSTYSLGNDTFRSATLVEFGECAGIDADGACVLPASRRLRLWVRSIAGADTALRGGQRPLSPISTTSTGAGTLYVIDVPPGAKSVSVVTSGRNKQHNWRLAVSPGAPAADLARANAHMNNREYAEALVLLDAALKDTTRPDRAEALRTRGRVLGRQGDVAASRRALRAAADSALFAGNSYLALLTSTALSYSLMHKDRDFDAAREAILRIPVDVDGHAETNYFRNYYLGLVGFNTGDVRGALAQLRVASAQARRLGWPKREIAAASLVAIQLRLLGDRRRANAILTDLRERLPENMDGCDRATFHTNYGWNTLLALEANEATDDPTAELEIALALTDKHCGTDHQVNALINLALAHYHGGRIETATDFLRQARERTDRPERGMVLWARDIEARIALHQGQANSALAIYENLQKLADATLSPSARWRAAIGRAQVFAALGRVDDALSAFASADELLDDKLLRVPLDAGRETLMASREWVTRAHLAMLLDSDRDREALDFARRARSRSLRAVHIEQHIASLPAPMRERWQRASADYQNLRDELMAKTRLSWTLPADELRLLERHKEQSARRLRRILDDAVAAVSDAPADVPGLTLADGELYINFTKLPEGWAAFSFDGDTLTALRVNCADPSRSALAECLIASLADPIGHAKLLRLSTPGELRDVDFHALSWRDGLLIDHLPIVYVADIARRDQTVPDQGRAVLVADPSGDLIQAREEVAAVQRLLERGGRWSTNVIAGVHAESQAVISALSGAGLFHYAGHARFEGLAGWDSALHLANGTRLDVGDVLALGRAPAIVILSGCETGAFAMADGPAASMGLANAFLAGGTRTVVATTRPVDDRSAYLMVEAFYKHFAQGETPAAAFNKAQRLLRSDAAERDWSAFRLIEP